MATIEELRAAVAKAEDALKAAKDALFEAEVEAHPLKVGMRIVDKHGKEGEVVSFAQHYSEVLPVYRRVLKDGSLGKDTFDARSWDGWGPK